MQRQEIYPHSRVFSHEIWKLGTMIENTEYPLNPYRDCEFIHHSPAPLYKDTTPSPVMRDELCCLFFRVVWDFVLFFLTVDIYHPPYMG